MATVKRVLTVFSGSGPEPGTAPLPAAAMVLQPGIKGLKAMREDAAKLIGRIRSRLRPPSRLWETALNYKGHAACCLILVAVMLVLWSWRNAEITVIPDRGGKTIQVRMSVISDVALATFLAERASDLIERHCPENGSPSLLADVGVARNSLLTDTTILGKGSYSCPNDRVIVRDRADTCGFEFIAGLGSRLLTFQYRFVTIFGLKAARDEAFCDVIIGPTLNLEWSWWWVFVAKIGLIVCTLITLGHYSTKHVTEEQHRTAWGMCLLAVVLVTPAIFLVESYLLAAEQSTTAKLKDTASFYLMYIGNIPKLVLSGFPISMRVHVLIVIYSVAGLAYLQAMVVHVAVNKVLPRGHFLSSDRYYLDRINVMRERWGLLVLSTLLKFESTYASTADTATSLIQTAGYALLSTYAPQTGALGAILASVTAKPSAS